MTTLALIGNGDFISCAEQLKHYDVIIALDGGYQHCQRLRVQPTVILGDGDSIQQPPTHFVPATDQDTTDLQKGFNYAQAHYPDAVIDAFCVTSHSRLDHTLAALQDERLRTVFTPYQQITRIADQFKQRCRIGQTFSLVPITATARVRITGSVWDGTDLLLNQARSGISNLTTASSLTIQVLSGQVWYIQSMTPLN